MVPDPPSQPDPVEAPSSDVALAALARYRLGDIAPPALINVSENATYRVDGAEGRPRFALRIHRIGYHTRAGIASELAWLMALRRDGVALTPVPLPGRDGELIQEVEGPVPGHRRYAVLFRWEDGREPSPTEDLAAKFAMLGETSARMHRHVRTWQRPAGFERHVWNFETSLGERPHWGSWRDGIGVDAAILPLFARTVGVIGERLARFGMEPERFGLIHADMRLANLLIHGDDVKVLDFDDCGFSWNLYDAAAAVSFFEHEPQVPDLLAAWVAGYRRIADLPAEDAAEMPTFVMLRRLLLVAWIGSHSDTDLARATGAAYTAGTVALCERYLAGFG
ncbi:MAG: phosphotransferase [Rhizobiales bacterium]|nr:phosphotransferase [Hyphomicrobiales bacterium]